MTGFGYISDHIHYIFLQISVLGLKQHVIYVW